MDLPLIKPTNIRQESAARILERIRKAKPKNCPRTNSETSHDSKQPEPTRLATHTTHMKNPIRKQLRRSLTELIPEIEEHHPLSSLAARVPRGKCPEPTGDKTGFGHAEEESSRDEWRVAVLESLKETDGSEEEELESEPFPGPDAVEDHVGWDFE